MLHHTHNNVVSALTMSINTHGILLNVFENRIYGLSFFKGFTQFFSKFFVELGEVGNEMQGIPLISKTKISIYLVMILLGVLIFLTPNVFLLKNEIFPLHFCGEIGVSADSVALIDA